VIKPALQDEAFVADVTAAKSEPGLHLWWLGQSGFLIQHRGRHLLMDPYLSDSLTLKYGNTKKPHVRISERVVAPERLDFIDVVSSSHGHTDHLDPDTLRPLLRVNPRLRVVVTESSIDVARQRLGIDASFDRLYGMIFPCAQQVGGFKFIARQAAHDALERDDAGNLKYLGYLVRSGDFLIYHSGDTVVFPRMAEGLRECRCDVAILPINGKIGNMNGREAARLAMEIGASVVIPCHYDMFEFNTADPRDEFIPECERLGQRYRVLKLGERFTYPEDAS
jgi:L-ascorbate metabolism protein UlaG (beta-lactamase superfamily)